jgi:hypothetical protein
MAGHRGRSTHVLGDSLDLGPGARDMRKGQLQRPLALGSHPSRSRRIGHSGILHDRDIDRVGCRESRVGLVQTGPTEDGGEQIAHEAETAVDSGTRVAMIRRLSFSLEGDVTRKFPGDGMGYGAPGIQGDARSFTSQHPRARTCRAPADALVLVVMLGSGTATFPAWAPRRRSLPIPLGEIAGTVAHRYAALGPVPQTPLNDAPPLQHGRSRQANKPRQRAAHRPGHDTRLDPRSVTTFRQSSHHQHRTGPSRMHAPLTGVSRNPRQRIMLTARGSRGPSSTHLNCCSIAHLRALTR